MHRKNRFSHQSLKLFIGAFLVAFATGSTLSCPGEKDSSEQKNTDPVIDKMVSNIQTDIDPEFVYEYKQTKFVPPEGKTLLIMGQSLTAITEYLDHFPDQPMPGGWAAYWGIPEFKGITESYRNTSGDTQNHQMLVDRFPNTVLHSALWMAGHWDVAKKAGNGAYDDVVRQYSAWAKTVSRPIYLRIGYEFDGPHNALEPDEYVAAYRHIVDLMRSEGADNIAFVWHSYGYTTYKNYPLSDWYPGDEYVDWVGLSVFGTPYDGDLNPESDAVLELAKKHRKPVMIAEANPVHGIAKDDADIWDQWFVNFFSLTYRKNIKAISFINEDWKRLTIDEMPADWTDARLYNNEQVSKAWFKETNQDRYLKQSPELFEQLGYSP
jgi:hypothetical protein